MFLASFDCRIGIGYGCNCNCKDGGALELLMATDAIVPWTVRSPDAKEKTDNTPMGDWKFGMNHRGLKLLSVSDRALRGYLDWERFQKNAVDSKKNNIDE